MIQKKSMTNFVRSKNVSKINNFAHITIKQPMFPLKSDVGLLINLVVHVTFAFQRIQL